jgi:hypothetical protein
MKEEFNSNIYLKRKKSVESLTSKLNQVEGRILGLKDKVDKLGYLNSNKEKIKYKKNIRNLWDTIRRLNLNHGQAFKK